MMRMQLLDEHANLIDELGDTLRRLPGAVKRVFDDDTSHAERVMVTAAWVLGGLGVLTLGLLAGRELRGRYKVPRRTPYDYYAHSGDRSSSLDYSVGI